MTNFAHTPLGDGGHIEFTLCSRVQVGSETQQTSTHVNTHTYTAYTPALFDWLSIFRSVVIAPCWSGGGYNTPTT